MRLVENGPRKILGPLDDAIWIGNEHPEQALGQCAVVQAAYRGAEGSWGCVAVVGPMRMAYATAQAAVHSVASTLGETAELMDLLRWPDAGGGAGICLRYPHKCGG